MFCSFIEQVVCNTEILVTCRLDWDIVRAVVKLEAVKTNKLQSTYPLSFANLNCSRPYDRSAVSGQLPHKAQRYPHMITSDWILVGLTSCAVPYAIFNDLMICAHQVCI